MKIKAAAWFVFACVLPLTPLLAHHSFSAEFDGTKAVELKGVVTKLDWANPHVWMSFDAKDDKGNVQHWDAGGPSPSRMQNTGWKHATQGAQQDGERAIKGKEGNDEV